MVPGIVSIPHTVRVDQCEDFLRTVTSGESVLEVPYLLDSNGAFGLESSLIHVVVSWARTSRRPCLRLAPSEESTTNTLGKLAQSSYGLSALVLAAEVSDPSGAKVPIHLVKGVVKRRLEELGSGNARLFGECEGLHVLGVYGDENEFTRWPFLGVDARDQPILEARKAVAKWLAPRMQRLLPEEFRGRLSDDRIFDLASITFELLENTALHARHNERLDVIQKGVRGITVRVIEVPFAATGAVSGRNPEVGLYFVNHALRDVSKKNLFLELCIFDSGVGYHRWANAPANLPHVSPELRGLVERETVRKCFLKHYTSRGEDGAGVGLWRVIKVLLGQFGFVRLRTGKTCFYARLDQRNNGSIRVPGEPFDDILKSGPPLKDWFPGTELVDSGGTSLTFSVPLTSWREDSH